MLETLLKNISDILKKNRSFFEENPELFLAVKERFEKAIEEDDPWDYNPRESNDPYFDDQDTSSNYDEDQAWDEESRRDPKYEDIDSDGSGQEFLPEEYAPEKSYDPFSGEDEDAEQERVLAELEQQQRSKKAEAAPTQQPKKVEPQKTDEDLYSDEDFADKPTEAKVGYRSQWKPKNSYAPHHTDAINNFMSQGYSNREAEALAGAHDRLSVSDAISRNMAPNDPSPKMMQMLQQHVGEIFSDKKMAASKDLNPEENPDLHLHANKNIALKQAHMPFKEAALAFRNNLKEQGKADHEIDNMMPAFKKQWHAENQAHVQNKGAAVDKIANIAKENKEARGKRLTEVKHAVIMAPKQGGESSPIVGDISGVAGGHSNKEAIRQAAGGVKGGDDEPTQVGTSVDPHYTMAVKNPAFVQHLEQQAIKQIAKKNPEAIKNLQNKLAPDQLARLKSIDGIKKGET